MNDVAGNPSPELMIYAGFTTSRPYAIEGPNGTFIVDQYVKAAHGKAAREFPFIAASSGKFSEVSFISIPVGLSHGYKDANAKYLHRVS